jgi:chemotaxis protein methyltransferase CheR
MNSADFDYLSTLLKARSGFVISNEKIYLLESRLLPVARSNGFQSLDELIRAMKLPTGGKLQTAVVEAMTTNETFFFRDKSPFEHLNEVILPHMLIERAKTRRLRIWCAAASTGQEPFSIAICLKEIADKIGNWHVDIIGTDISNDVLEKARAGLYSQFEVQRGLPIQQLVKYFKQMGELWQIDSNLRSMVDYRPFNLLDDFAPLGKFDIIFCRNVLIYFDREGKSDVLDRLSKQLAPDGYLLLGAAETVIGLSNEFKPVAGKRGLYQSTAAVNNGGMAQSTLATPTNGLATRVSTTYQQRTG